jgi:LCP family protein required for cell wall assembly
LEKTVKYLGIFALLFFALAFFSRPEGELETLVNNLGKERVTALVLGLDASGRRADAMILATYDAPKNHLDFTSIPRDTQVQIPENRIAVLEESEHYVPSSGIVKLNQVYYYGGDDYGAQYTIKQVQELLGVSVDYYVAVDLEAFRKIVDAVGGVEFDVPFEFTYHDPAQGLSIDLKPGLQVLNGSAAEGLVRFRKSDDGELAYYTDWNRSETQRLFLKALITQACQSEKLLTSAPEIAQTLFEYVKTDISKEDIITYAKMLSKLKTATISSHSLKGTDKKISGQWYTMLDVEASRAVIAGIFNDEASFAKAILVLNGARIDSLARRHALFLESLGYTNVKFETYQDEDDYKDYTRIKAKEAGIGEDLKTLYPEAKYEVDGSIDCDVMLILGKDA